MPNLQSLIKKFQKPKDDLEANKPSAWVPAIPTGAGVNSYKPGLQPTATAAPGALGRLSSPASQAFSAQPSAPPQAAVKPAWGQLQAPALPINTQPAAVASQPAQKPLEFRHSEIEPLDGPLIGTRTSTGSVSSQAAAPGRRPSLVTSTATSLLPAKPPSTPAPPIVVQAVPLQQPLSLQPGMTPVTKAPVALPAALPTDAQLDKQLAALQEQIQQLKSEAAKRTSNNRTSAQSVLSTAANTTTTPATVTTTLGSRAPLTQAPVAPNAVIAAANTSMTTPATGTAAVRPRTSLTQAPVVAPSSQTLPAPALPAPTTPVPTTSFAVSAQPPRSSEIVPAESDVPCAHPLTAHSTDSTQTAKAGSAGAAPAGLKSALHNPRLSIGQAVTAPLSPSRLSLATRPVTSQSAAAPETKTVLWRDHNSWVSDEEADSDRPSRGSSDGSGLTGKLRPTRTVGTKDITASDAEEPAPARSHKSFSALVKGMFTSNSRPPSQSGEGGRGTGSNSGSIAGDFMSSMRRMASGRRSVSAAQSDAGAATPPKDSSANRLNRIMLETSASMRRMLDHVTPGPLRSGSGRRASVDMGLGSGKSFTGSSGVATRSVDVSLSGNAMTGAEPSKPLGMSAPAPEPDIHSGLVPLPAPPPRLSLTGAQPPQQALTQWEAFCAGTLQHPTNTHRASSTVASRPIDVQDFIPDTVSGTETDTAVVRHSASELGHGQTGVGSGLGPTAPSYNAVKQGISGTLAGTATTGNVVLLAAAASQSASVSANTSVVHTPARQVAPTPASTPAQRPAGVASVQQGGSAGAAQQAAPDPLLEATVQLLLSKLNALPTQIRTQIVQDLCDKDGQLHPSASPHKSEASRSPVKSVMASVRRGLFGGRHQRSLTDGGGLVSIRSYPILQEDGTDASTGVAIDTQQANHNTAAGNIVPAAQQMQNHGEAQTATTGLSAAHVRFSSQAGAQTSLDSNTMHGLPAVSPIVTNQTSHATTATRRSTDVASSVPHGQHLHGQAHAAPMQHGGEQHGCTGVASQTQGYAAMGPEQTQHGTPVRAGAGTTAVAAVATPWPSPYAPYGPMHLPTTYSGATFAVPHDAILAAMRWQVDEHALAASRRASLDMPGTPASHAPGTPTRAADTAPAAAPATPHSSPAAVPYAPVLTLPMAPAMPVHPYMQYGYPWAPQLYQPPAVILAGPPPPLSPAGPAAAVAPWGWAGVPTTPVAAAVMPATPWHTPMTPRTVTSRNGRMMVGSFDLLIDQL